MSFVAPISACLIVKNESGQLKFCLQSIRPYVEEIVVVDTGSVDSSQDIAKEFADKFEIFTDCNDDQGRIVSFALARQRSFDLATKPWCFWVDGDDEVVGANKLIDVVNKAEKEKDGRPTMIMLPYEYSHDENGNVTCLHYRERIINPKSEFEWKGPVHEVCSPKSSAQALQSDAVKIVHKRQKSGKVIEPNRNLRILKSHYEKVGESDVRQLYYLGLEYGNAGDIGNSIKFHKRYVELSGWDDEKFLACMKISEHYQGFGDYENAIQWALKALTVREGWSEAYFSLGKSYYFMAQRGGPEEKRNWEKCVHFIRLGLQMPPTRTVLFINPMERQFEMHRFLNLALNKIGDVRGALESCDTALKIKPDSSIELNRNLYVSFLAKSDITNKINDLVNAGGLSQEVKNTVLDLINSNDISKINNTKIEPIAVPSNKLDIVFYVGPGVEPWNPDIIKKNGIGGSETAVYEMSRRLVKFGHSVRVFGHCENIEGNFDGVNYLNFTKYRNISCDVLITSRRPRAIDDEFNVSSKVSFCWVHDIHCGNDLNHSRSLRIDKFLVLSNWHREFFLNHYKFIHPSQVITTRNGIDLSRFDNKIQRNPHRAVYSSSPDRGMEVVTKVWPKIREVIPDAELHLFYGFETWESCARSAGDNGQLDLIQRLKQMIKDYEKYGVYYHGRVDQNQLAKEFLASGVWAYSTWFSETSCLTAMEAQCAGLRIVTSPIAALNETVGSRGKMIPGDWLSEEYQRQFTESVIEVMLKPDNGDRSELQDYAKKHFCIDKLASQWDEMFRNVIEEISINIVPPYKEAC